MPLSKHLTTLFCSLLLFGGASSTARAEYVTMFYVAKVTSVHRISGLKVGDVLKGTFTYDRATLSTSSPHSHARNYQWNSGESGITIYSNAGTFRTKPSAVDVMAQVANNQPSPGQGVATQDMFYMHSTNNEFPASAPNLLSTSISIWFADTKGWPLNSTKLPFSSVFYLPHWDYAWRVAIFGEDHEGPLDMTADILSIEEIQ